MEYKKLPEPSLFLEAALANFDEAEWIMWQEGICVRRENSLLAMSSEDTGSICYFSDIKDVFSIDGDIVILSTDGVFIWDGEEEPEKMDIPTLPHLKINPLGVCGWKDFRYHVWFGKNEYILPEDCTKPRFFPSQACLFWTFWGKIFLWEEGKEIQCLEAIPENYEEIIPLENKWLAIIYEKKIVGLHTDFPKKRFDNDQIFEVRASIQSDCLWILLGDGTLLEWNLLQEDEPEEIGFFEGAEGFVGEGLLLVDDEIVSFWDDE